MPFIGNQPALSYTSFTKQDFSTSATTSYTLDNPVANANELALFINFVRQEPTTAYSASGTTLTLTSATSASDDMYCVFLGKAVQTVNPPSGSVGTAQLVDDAVTKDKLLAHNYPAFFAYRTAGQSISNNTVTKVQMNVELFDTDTAYDNSTNYRFTVPSGKAGKYYISAYARHGNFTAAREVLLLYKNGSIIMQGESGNAGAFQTLQISTVSELSAGDYLELFGFQNSGSSQTLVGDGIYQSGFFAYRIGD